MRMVGGVATVVGGLAEKKHAVVVCSKKNFKSKLKIDVGTRRF